MLFQNHTQKWSFVAPRPSRLSHLLHPFSLSLSSMTTTQASSNPPPSNPYKTVRVVVKGRVQGVFYRNWTIENATQLGIKGWVRNRRDGSVEALFSGTPDSVQEMEQRCRRGPPDAMVTGLEVFPCSDDSGTGFQRKPTIQFFAGRDSKTSDSKYIQDKLVCLVKMRRGGMVLLRLVRKMLTRVFMFSRRSFFNVIAAAAGGDCDDDWGPLPGDVEEGHFVVQTICDGELERFVIELGYLAHPGFLKLLEKAEQEFGFEQEGVLAVPCGPNELQRILGTQKAGIVMMNL